MSRSAALRILALALAVGAVAAVVLPGNAIGVNVPLLAVALAAAAVAAAGEAGLRRVDRADVWLAPAAIAFAAVTAIRTDPWLVSLDLLVSAALLTAAISTLGGARVTRGAAGAVVESAFGAVMAGVIGVMVVVSAGLRRDPRQLAGDATPGASPARRVVLPVAARPVLRGLVIALPLVLVFTALFSAADAVFGRIAASLLDWRINLDFGVLTLQAFVAAFVAWGAAGLLALGASALPGFDGHSTPAEPGPWAQPSPSGQAAASPRPLLGPVEAVTVLVVLDALFAAFVGLQVAYLFGGRDTLAASGLTYADYARRGFFELVVAAAVAGSIAVGLDRLVSRRTGAQIAASVALLALTLVILASALARLHLYQDAYGWTELRFAVLASIAWLAFAVVATTLLLLRDRARWVLHALGVAWIVVFGAMNVVGPESFVAQQNLERAANPVLVPSGGSTGLDGDYLGTLGDEAVLPAIAALPTLAPDDRATVKQMLDDRAAALAFELPGEGWPSWNLARLRARDALAAWQAQR